MHECKFKWSCLLSKQVQTKEWETDRKIGAAEAVLRLLYRTAVTKREARLSVCRSIFVPTLT